MTHSYFSLSAAPSICLFHDLIQEKLKTLFSFPFFFRTSGLKGFESLEPERIHQHVSFISHGHSLVVKPDVFHFLSALSNQRFTHFTLGLKAKENKTENKKVVSLNLPRFDKER